MPAVASLDPRVLVVEHDSPLGRWRFAMRPASPPLDRFVEMVWCVEGSTAHRREKILPYGRVELLVNLGPAHGLLDRPSGLVVPYREAWVSGIQESYLVIEGPAVSSMAGIRFRPAGARSFFGVAMDDLCNRVIDIDLVLGAAIRETRQRLLAETEPAAKLDLLERLARQRIDPAASGVSREVAWATACLVRSGGGVRIGAIRTELGWSRRRLAEAFRREIGTTPKLLARILRLQGLVAALPADGPVDWATTALDHGYYDQSHLHRDLRELGDVTATALLASRVPDGGGVFLNAD